MPIFHRKVLIGDESGFSLLELLVVLAITSVMLSLVSVRLVQSIESNQFFQTSQAAVSDIKILRAQAVLTSQSFVLITDETPPVLLREIDKESQRRLNVPEEWSVSGPTINISPSGFCSGGVVTIKDSKGRMVEYYLSSPKCEPVRDLISAS